MSARIRCFSTLGCPELSVRQAATLAAAHGISALELRVISGSLDVPGGLAAEFGTPGAYGDWVRETGIAILGLGTSVRLFGEQFDMAELLAFSPWADAAGTPFLRIFDGGDQLGEEDYRQAADRLKAWARERHSHGFRVELMVETHDALVRPDQLSTFVKRLPKAKILWDTHHTWASGGADPIATWRVIAPNVVHLHVKDSVAKADGRTYVLPGQGEFPMQGLLSILAEYPRSLPVSLEWEKQWHKHLAPLDDALRAARGWW